MIWLLFLIFTFVSIFSISYDRLKLSFSLRHKLKKELTSFYFVNALCLQLNSLLESKDIEKDNDLEAL